MDLDAYQRFTQQTALYPAVTETAALTYLSLGLTGEAGEVADHAKKVLRDDGARITGRRHAAIVAELGDVLWYVARLADELGEDLSAVAQKNIDKLTGRQARGTLKGSGDNR